MLNRKATKMSNGAGNGNGGRAKKRVSSGEVRKPRKRFIISAKAAGRLASPTPPPPEQVRNEEAQAHSASRAKAAYASNHEAAAPGARDQAVEICKRIEEAELEMKRLVYGLGFTAKEHIATAEKLLAEPPKERFDRIVVDKKVATREGHLKELRSLVKKIRALDAQVDEQ